MVLRLCPILQVIEMAIEFLTENENFDQTNIENFNQPLLPNASIIKPESVTSAIKVMEVCQKQRDMLSGENTESEIIEILDEKVDKDVLLHGGKEIKGASYLTKRKNPYSGNKHTKEEYETSFHRLHSHGIGLVTTKTGRNNKETKIFTKKNLAEIAMSPLSLDLWPSNVSFKAYSDSLMIQSTLSGMSDTTQELLSDSTAQPTASGISDTAQELANDPTIN